MIEAAGKASAGVVTVRVLWLLTTIKAPRGEIKERGEGWKGWLVVVLRGMDGRMMARFGYCKCVPTHRGHSHETVQIEKIHLWIQGLV